MKQICIAPPPTPSNQGFKWPRFCVCVRGWARGRSSGLGATSAEGGDTNPFHLSALSTLPSASACYLVICAALCGVGKVGYLPCAPEEEMEVLRSDLTTACRTQHLSLCSSCITFITRKINIRNNHHLCRLLDFSLSFAPGRAVGSRPQEGAGGSLLGFHPQQDVDITSKDTHTVTKMNKTRFLQSFFLAFLVF